MAFLQRTMNRGSVSTGYDIDYSIKFEADNSEQLYRTPSSDGNMKTWTYSVWFKRTELGASQTLIAALDTYMYFETNDTAWLNLRSASTNFFMATNRVFRDTSAWYHAVIACDTTDSTAADRLKLYINGVRETSFSNNTYENIDGNDDTGMNKATVHRIGQYSNYGSKFSGYMAEANLIDGQALAPTEFGEFDDDSGIWKPKEYTGTYGTNGFYLDFADASDLGDDESGNGNDFTEGAITSADQATDTPTNNFATLNVLEPDTSNTLTYTEGATKVVSTGNGPYPTSKGTFGAQNGKWYFELKAGTMNYASQVGAVGLALPEHISASYPHDNAGAYVYRSNGDKLTQGSTTSYGDGWSTNDIIGVAIDLDNNTLSFYRNNTSQGQAFTGLTETYLPAIYADGTTLEVNFGGYTSFSISSAETDANGYGTFEYAPPSGYYALCGKNLAEYGGTA